MCGRYYMDEETLRDMEGVVQSLDERIRTQACGIVIRPVRPE
mgnify:CR=1 FL=1